MFKKILVGSLAAVGVFAVAYATLAADNSNYVNVSACTQVGSDIQVTRSGKTYTLTSTCRDAGHGYRQYQMSCTSQTQYKVSWTENCTPAKPKDTTTPSASVSTNKSEYDRGATINVTVGASDNVKVTKLELYRDDNKVKEENNSTGFSYSYQANYTGSIQFKVRAYDAAGNVGTNSVTVRVRENNYDSTSPSLDLTSNRSSYEVGNTVYLTARASDNHGIKKISIYNENDDLLRTCEWTNVCETSEYLRSSDYYNSWRDRNYYARAYDENGNSAYDNLSVTVYRDYDYNYDDDDNRDLSISVPISTYNESGVTWIKINANAYADEGLNKIEIYVGDENRKSSTSLMKRCEYGSDRNAYCTLNFPRGLYHSGYYYARVTDDDGRTRETDLNYFNY